MGTVKTQCSQSANPCLAGLAGVNRGDHCIASAEKAKCDAAVQGAYSNLCKDAAPTVRVTVDVRAATGFPEALDYCISHGRRITRAGWNGEGQWVVSAPTLKVPYLCLRNVQGDLTPWAPSQTDMFSRDWAVLPS